MIDSEPQAGLTTEMLLLPNGEILVHNLTPTMAALLAGLNPADPSMRERAWPCLAPDTVAPLQNRQDEAIG